MNGLGRQQGQAMSATTKAVLTASAVALITLLVYLPALNCSFVNLDDPDYVLNNLFVRQFDGASLTYIFTRPVVGWWMPLTWLSLAIDYHFWDLNPLGYHLTNVLLHSLNAGLVVLIADRLLQGQGSRVKGQRAFLYLTALVSAGLLWGIHPLRVESVAWITERKDVLNGFFSLGAVFTYIGYARKRSSGGGGSAEYWISLLLFTCSLMSKSISVIIPFMLLVIDWYPLGRFDRTRIRALVQEKAPFFALSMAMVIITIGFASETGYLVSYTQFPFSQRLVVSGSAIFTYLRLMLFPFYISPMHIVPDPVPVSYTVKTVLVFLGFAVVIMYGRQKRLLLAASLAFVIPLLPVLAFFQNGDQAFASRFTYLPSVLPSIAVAGVIGSIAVKLAGCGVKRANQLVFFPAIALLVFYGGMTIKLIGVWKDSGTMWSRTMEVEPSAILFKERGRYYYAAGMFDKAAEDYTAAINSASGGFKAYVYNLYAFRGEALRAAGRLPEAAQDFSTAIGLSPQPPYFRLRGEILREMGRLAEAEQDFKFAGTATGQLEWYWIPRHD
jgi:hypothetical protein